MEANGDVTGHEYEYGEMGDGAGAGAGAGVGAGMGDAVLNCSGFVTWVGCCKRTEGKPPFTGTTASVFGGGTACCFKC